MGSRARSDRSSGSVGMRCGAGLCDWSGRSDLNGRPPEPHVELRRFLASIGQKGVAHSLCSLHSLSIRGRCAGDKESDRYAHHRLARTDAECSGVNLAHLLRIQ
jgi:hypothetical protein